MRGGRTVEGSRTVGQGVLRQIEVVRLGDSWTKRMG